MKNNTPRPLARVPTKLSPRLACFRFTACAIIVFSTTRCLVVEADTFEPRSAKATESVSTSVGKITDELKPLPDGLLRWQITKQGSAPTRDNFSLIIGNLSSARITLLKFEPSCGCTTAKLPSLPWVIEPGQSSQIGVSVDLSGKTGVILNTINVVTDRGYKVLGLQSEVASVKKTLAVGPPETRDGTQIVRDQVLAKNLVPVWEGDGVKNEAGDAITRRGHTSISQPIPADAVDKSILGWMSGKPIPSTRKNPTPSEESDATGAGPKWPTSNRDFKLPPHIDGRSRQLEGACFNGDLENGNLSGWVGYFGSRAGSATIALSALVIGTNASRLTVVGPGFDPFIQPTVAEGNYALRIGNWAGGAEATGASYTFTVTQANKHFSFRYAVGLQDPTDHTADQKPFFSYYLMRGSSIYFTSGNLPIAATQIIADRNNPFFTTVSGDVVCRGWTTVCLDLSNYVGQTMTMAFFTADCSKVQHFGYAYVDGLCTNNDPTASFTMPTRVCPGAPVLVDGSASTNEDSYFWSVEESDANWGRNPATEISHWFIANQAGALDLADPSGFYLSHGGTFKCNTYYRVKLAVTNQCGAWVETVKLLYVHCPVVTAGPDLCVSCRSPGTTVQLGIGNSTAPANTYTWTPATGLDNPSSPSPLHTQGSVNYPFTYHVTVTDSMGCKASDDVTLYCRPPTIRISQRPYCCGVHLDSNAQGYTSITWSTGATNVPSIDVTHSGIYNVTATNPCGSVSASVTVVSPPGMTGFFNPISYNSQFSPPSGSGAYRDKLYIMDVVSGNGAANVPNSYNATDYKLEIFDRWGNLFKTIVGGPSCTGFNNWAICWDGTDSSGQLVQQDVYVWKLTMKNCQYDWQIPNERKFVDPQCVRWATLFGIKLWCREWDHPGPTTVDVPIAAGSVTVVR